MPEYKELACREVGENLPDAIKERLYAQFEQRATVPVSGFCDFVARGPTVEEVLETVSAHGSQEHGMSSWPPELWVHMRRHVRTVGTA